jgi:hypothetical protein
MLVVGIVGWVMMILLLLLLVVILLVILFVVMFASMVLLLLDRLSRLHRVGQFLRVGLHTHTIVVSEGTMCEAQRGKCNYRLQLGWGLAILKHVSGLQVVQQGRNGTYVDA